MLCIKWVSENHALMSCLDAGPWKQYCKITAAYIHTQTHSCDRSCGDKAFNWQYLMN